MKIVLSLLVALTAVVTAAGAPAYPLKKSGNGRCLVDQNDTPFLLVGDSPQSLIVNLNSSDAASYLHNRATNGFNAVLIDLLAVAYTGGRSDGSTFDGIKPFTKDWDLTTPNETYFARVDERLSLCASNGLVVFLDPLETGGWLDVAVANGANNCYLYGQYVGHRYKDYANIVWFHGNDYDVTLWTVPTNDVVIKAVAQGIASVDTNHIQTILFGAPSDSLSNNNWADIIGANCVYTYYPTYAEMLRAYGRTNSLPAFLGEAHYELETQGYPSDSVEFGTPWLLRQQEYWSMLSGGCGQLYGNHYTWTFESDWPLHLDTQPVRELQYATGFFTNLAWSSLVPDSNHAILTSGYGDYATNGLASSNDYAACAWLTNGSLAVVYSPTQANRTLTVDLSKFSGAVQSRWFDPTAGTYTTISGSPFASTGSHIYVTPAAANAAGATDWVLIISEAVDSRLSIQDAGGGAFRLTLAGAPGRTYRIEYSDQLSLPGADGWTLLGTATLDAVGAGSFETTNTIGATSRFYRTVYP